MGFLKNLLTRDEPIRSYEDFWKWFAQHESKFFRVVQDRGNVEKGLFDVISPKLAGIKDGLFLLAGILNRETTELIITPDGYVPNVVFAEELVTAAPPISGWRFTALKPPAGSSFTLSMKDVKVSEANLRFAAKESWEQPDKIDLLLTHEQINAENRKQITNAIFLFLDNFLGEQRMITEIDNINVADPAEAEEWNPIQDLTAYLDGRTYAFVEKYEGIRANTDSDNYSMLEAVDDDDLPYLAMINTTLLTWDRKPSHPWVAGIQMKYPDRRHNGLPGESNERLNEIEREIEAQMRDIDGYLNIGHDSKNNVRTIYFACKDFRLPSKVFYDIQKAYTDQFQIKYDIYKDKYWETFDRFLPVDESSGVN